MKAIRTKLALAFAVALVPTLGGCNPFETKDQVVNACEFEATKLMANSPLTGNDRRSAENRIAVTCVKARGFKGVSGSESCAYFLGPSTTNFFVVMESRCWER